jgi:abequosyltransferase
MKPILSICIPTYNRPAWLLIALNSVFNSEIYNNIEICISNNASEHDYSAVETLITLLNNNFISVNYYKQDKLIEIDENHQFVINMAKSDHIFLLGDDDYFLNNQLYKLLDFIITVNPDLAIFNGIKVDENGRNLGRHFNLPHRSYIKIDEAFHDLRDKGSFGSVLTRRAYFHDKLFQSFYGTQHGYGIFWLALFEEDNKNHILKIIIPDFECVALRHAQKTYNKIEIFYIDIPLWFNIFYFYSKYPKYRKLTLDYYKYYYEKVTSLSFLQNLFVTGSDLSVIPNFFAFDSSYVRLKIAIIKFYNFLKG